MNLSNTEDKLVIHSSHGICYGIIIFYFLTVRNMTLNHIHNIKNLPNLSTILNNDHILHENIKRKCRIYKIQSKVQNQNKIAKDIIPLFNSKTSYF